MHRHNIHHLFSIRLGVACFAAVLLVNTGNLYAQQDNTNTGGDTTGGTGTGETGARFEGVETDLSVFDQIERGDAVGTSTTQGFGIVAEQGGGGGGAAGGFGGGAGGLGGGFGGLGGLLGGLGGAFGGQTTTTAKPIIRVRIRSAIDVAPRTQEAVERSASRTFAYAPPRSGVRGVAVTMDGTTAILRGTVATEKDRRMSELLIKLEPGVRSVDNRVVVAE